MIAVKSPFGLITLRMRVAEATRNAPAAAEAKHAAGGAHAAGRTHAAGAKHAKEDYDGRIVVRDGKSDEDDEDELSHEMSC